MGLSRLLVVVAAAMCATGLLACSGASPAGSEPRPSAGDAGGEDAGDDGGDDLGWGVHTDVEAVLEANCAECHSTQWASCWDVQASASDVGSAVSSGAMPRGSTLSAADKSTLLDWIQAGAPCTGTEPADAGPVGPTVLAGARPHHAS
jgi:hypothetical protein